MTYATRELEPETWPDFERLFRPGTGWAFCACMLYQRGCHLPAREYPTREVARIEKTTTPENGNWAHAGTVPSFEGAGFGLHRRSDSPYVVMRRTIRPTAPS